MGLDVTVHVMNKDWEIVQKDFLDFLPIDFRFTFYPDCCKDWYTNSFTRLDLRNDAYYSRAMSIDNMCAWMTFVSVSDVKEYLNEHVIIAVEAKPILELDDSLVLVVAGDQIYDNFIIANNAVKYGKSDEWFNACTEGVATRRIIPNDLLTKDLVRNIFARNSNTTILENLEDSTILNMAKLFEITATSAEECVIALRMILK